MCTVYVLYWNISLSSFFQIAEVAVKYVNNANVTLPLFLKNCREKKVYILIVITTCQQLDKGLAVLVCSLIEKNTRIIGQVSIQIFLCNMIFSKKKKWPQHFSQFDIFYLPNLGYIGAKIELCDDASRIFFRSDK